jgi:signal transduction histidine kinase
LLQKNINCIEKIHLSYKQNSFTIKYAGLNFTSAHHNQYKYKLEGFDKNWQQAGHFSQASYTNLKGGKYRFFVMASNNDGIWNTEARTVYISIDPPPWKTWWALVIYILLIAAVVGILYYYNIRKIKLQHQLALQTKESENLRDIDNAKSHFFTSISHEFRTPLTLIIDPANQLLQDKQMGIKQEKLINLILKNARRLLSLINQILDLAKLRNSRLILRAEEVDFIMFIKPILNMFISGSFINKLGSVA